MFCLLFVAAELTNGWLYGRWDGDDEAVQPEKGSGVGGPQNLLHRFSFCEFINQFV